MHPTYRCNKCKEHKPSTEEHWVPSSLKKAKENAGRVSLGYCKPCSRIASADNIRKIKEAGLTRSQKPLERNIRGKIYIIGPKDNRKNLYPYKIGVSSGTTIHKRLTGLQTSHWIDLTVLYESDILDNIHKVESKLHKEYEATKVRGEWFKINSEDIKKIISTLES